MNQNIKEFCFFAWSRVPLEAGPPYMIDGAEIRLIVELRSGMVTEIILTNISKED
jgi:hypothetical protein